MGRVLLEGAQARPRGGVSRQPLGGPGFLHFG